MTKTKAKAKKAGTHLDKVGRKHKGQSFDCAICNWAGPKSICTCGHAGDGDNSAHAGSIGHGECLLCSSGKCRKFTWCGFDETYTNAQKAVKA